MEKNLVPSIVKDQHLVKRRREQMVNAAVVLLKKKGLTGLQQERLPGRQALVLGHFMNT